MARIEFEILEPSTTTLHFDAVQLVDGRGNEIPASGQDALVAYVSRVFVPFNVKPEE